MSDAVAQLESHLDATQQPKNPLRANQVQEFEEERQRLRSIVTAPAWQAGADRGAATKRYKQIEKLMHEQAPKALDGARRDVVAKLAETVLQDVIRPALLPESHMRRNPAGAVDKFLRRENSKPIKKAILTWKRALRAIEPDNVDQDYTNIERFRPSGYNPDGTSTFMADAQIPGKFAMSSQAKENWPLGEPTAETALGQVQAREKKPMSDAQKAALAAGRAKAIAAKQASSAGAPIDDPGVSDNTTGI